MKHKKNINSYDVVAETKNLNISLVPYQESDNVNVECDEVESIPVKIKLNEVRVSGYLLYSIAIDAIKKSENFSINTTQTERFITKGWLQEDSMIPVESKTGEQYIIIGYVSDLDLTPQDIKINVNLTNLKIKEKIEDGTNVMFLLNGVFEIVLA